MKQYVVLGLISGIIVFLLLCFLCNEIKQTEKLTYIYDTFKEFNLNCQ